MDFLIQDLKEVIDVFERTFNSEVEDSEVALLGKVLAKKAEAVVDWYMD